MLHANPPQDQRSLGSFANALSTSARVSVRGDGVPRPLQPTYAGLFRVVGRGPKMFTLDFAGRHDPMSVKQIKPATVNCGLNDELSSHEFH